MSKLSDTDKQLTDACAEIMQEMKGMFRPHMKLTLIIRNSKLGDPARDLILSEDTLDDVVKCAERLRTTQLLSGTH